MDTVDVVPKPYVRIEMGAGRANWIAPFSVAVISHRVSALMIHHDNRLFDERARVERAREALQDAVRDYQAPDPNRTRVAEWDSPKARAENELGLAQRAVTTRLAKMGELSRWATLLDRLPDDHMLALTIDDVAYFRMGAHDGVDDEDDTNG